MTAPRRSVRRSGSAVQRGALLVAAVAIAGCSVTETFSDLTRVDYKRATRGPALDVPPDLVTPRTDDRFQVPDRPGAGTTFSAYARERGAEPRASSGPAVMPRRDGVRIERQGMQRWLVVDQPPEKVWPVVREFWNDAGFALRVDSPETGIMETDWAEKRARVPDSLVRNQLARVLNSVYAAGERDKFRTRLETDGKVTEVYVSHRGMVEEITGPQKESTLWVPRASDPELEAEFLRRIMLRVAPAREGDASVAALGGGTGARAPMAEPPDRARVVELDGRPFVALQDPFDRAWRQVGLALDRSGFTVEDRDRSKGTFFVRYVDPEQEARTTGVLDRIFGSGPQKDLSGKRYRIVVEDASGGARVGVLGEEGAAPAAESDRRIATRIVGLLRDQLR